MKVLNKYKSLFLTLLIAVAIFSMGDLVCASDPGNLKDWQTQLDKGQTETTVYKPIEGKPYEEIARYIGMLLNLSISIGMIFLIRIVWAGYIWMTAAGNAEKMEEAKKIITFSTVAIVILMSAYAIMYFVVYQLRQITYYGG